MNTCRKTLITISLFVFSFLVLPAVLAATLTLDNIGALNTSGNRYSEWWYTGTFPVLSGTADANAEVSVTIDDSTSSLTADGSGNWSYSPALGAGDYNVTLVSGDQSYAFVLHLGQDVPTDLGASGSMVETTQSSVPETGANQLLALLMFTGLAGFSYMKLVSNPKKDKEAKIVRDL